MMSDTRGGDGVDQNVIIVLISCVNETVIRRDRVQKCEKIAYLMSFMDGPLVIKP